MSAEDGEELRRLRDEADRARDIIERIVSSEQLEYYRKLRDVRRGGATHRDIQQALDVSKARPGQLLRRADEVLGPDEG